MLVRLKECWFIDSPNCEVTSVNFDSALVLWKVRISQYYLRASRVCTLVIDGAWWDIAALSIWLARRRNLLEMTYANTLIRGFLPVTLRDIDDFHGRYLPLRFFVSLCLMSGALILTFYFGFQFAYFRFLFYFRISDSSKLKNRRREGAIQTKILFFRPWGKLRAKQKKKVDTAASPDGIPAL